MVKKGKNFSGKVTPLFDSMLVQQTEDEGEASERPSDSQPIPSHPNLSEDQPQTQTDPFSRPTPSIVNLIPIQRVTDQAKENKLLKAQIKKLKKKAKPGYVSPNRGEIVKSFKGEPFVHKDLNFEDLDDFVDVDDTLDYMETEDDQDEGRTISVVLEEKESIDKEPLPKIDPKDKGKKVIDEEGESDTESEDITEAEKKFKMLAKDEEVLLYERLKRQDQNFVAIGSAKDERQIKKLNKDPKKKRVIKETPREEDTAKHWLVQKQMDFELAIPEQTATGKGISNPLMAGSLPKTTKPT
ncbi:hypothetical protein Tco_0865275 [Tanacetum coccineum]